jgi:hypothetical protein
MPEAVVPGHYTSEDVTDEQFAEAYARATGRPYRKAVHTIKSNAAL